MLNFRDIGHHKPANATAEPAPPPKKPVQTLELMTFSTWKDDILQLTAKSETLEQLGPMLPMRKDFKELFKSINDSEKQKILYDDQGSMIQKSHDGYVQLYHAMKRPFYPAEPTTYSRMQLVDVLLNDGWELTSMAGIANIDFKPVVSKDNLNGGLVQFWIKK